MDFVENALNLLSDKGYKTTKTRQLVLDALNDCSKPSSPYDLQKHILDSEKININHVTIYRILDLLESLKLIHKVSSGAYLKCGIPFEEGCHHFVVCGGCGKTEEFIAHNHSHVHLPTKLESQFDIIGHTFELNAICKKCIK
jgi:Fur family zinc uptake transcriptional regulator